MRQSRPNAVLGSHTALPHTVIIARGERIRHFVVRPWMAFAAGASFLALAAASALGAANLFFHDDLLTAAMTQNDDLRASYEQRIATLRAELDRMTSKQLLGQQEMEKKVTELLRRQAELSERHEIIEPIAQRANSEAETAPLPSPRPEKHVDAGGLSLRGVDGAPVLVAYAPETEDNVPWPLRGGSSATAGKDDALATIDRSLTAIASEQVDRIGQMTETAYEAADAISGALRAVGFGTDGGKEEDVGGPYLPVGGELVFESRVQELDNALDQLDSLKKEARELPLLNPAPGHTVTSRFGVRPDPMLGKPAFHAGMDFRAAYGSPVHATAPGTVLRAGWAGGYGRMVEIDNGNGITVRFGHLSKILVSAGEKVKAGDLLGKSGSSGRSTGPHLHYEIRKNGEPVNPVTFLKAGKRISRYL